MDNCYVRIIVEQLRNRRQGKGEIGVGRATQETSRLQGSMVEFDVVGREQTSIFYLRIR